MARSFPLAGRKRPGSRISLEHGDTVVTVGAGPAGAMFCLSLVRQAKQLGKDLRVVILERRKEFGGGARQTQRHRKGCNFCAGGISPRLNDLLAGMRLTLPPETIKNTIRSITVQCHWKNIEFMIPHGRQMLAVYRGSLPTHRADGFYSFDTFLLDQAIREGAQLIEGEAVSVEYSDSRRPLVTVKTGAETRILAADFVAFAGGVNYLPRQVGESSPFVQSLRRLLPEFQPPQLRRSLIFELEVDKGLERELEGEIFFIESGSPALPLEMCSLVPKGQFVTVVLVGPTIDRLTDLTQVPPLIKEFLRLPHLKKLLPGHLKLEPVCSCLPNLVIGTAKKPFGDRLAVLGDMATSRLYKDGILTACQTSLALANTMLNVGLDAGSLRAGYWPVVRHIGRDNRYGRLVFALHNLIFRSPVLSRVVYQAVITERKERRTGHRQLENILWRIASGDDWYRNILASMLRPHILWTMVTQGILITLRNFLTEQLFGLRWQGFGRFTTGVSKERLEGKRLEYRRVMEAEALPPPPASLEFERMYSIKIKAQRSTLAEELGKFGEPDRLYFRPNLIEVRRLDGRPNEPGTTLQYRVVFPWLNFGLRLERVVAERYFIYRVINGFARGGVLIFEMEDYRPETDLLSIYVAFEFYRGMRWYSRPVWWILKLLFPAFVHDVLWNHALCRLKDNVESSDEDTRLLASP